MSNFFESLKNQLETIKDKKIVFWGASLFLDEFLEKYSLEKYSILGVIDNNSNRWGQKINKYTILPPKSLIDMGKVCIIVTIKNNYTKVFAEIERIIETFQDSNKEISLIPNTYEIAQRDLFTHSLASNKLYLVDSKGIKHPVSYIEGLKINWLSENAEVTIGANPLPKFKNCSISCDKNSKVHIGSSAHEIKSLNIAPLSQDSQIVIGNNFSTEGAEIRLSEPNTEIHIGNDCMLSYGIEIRVSDSHAIYDIKTNEILNHPKKITIGNHVWIGIRTIVLKGSEIKNNSVIGANTLISKKFDESNVVIVGNPARIVRRNINWNRKTATDFIKKEIF